MKKALKITLISLIVGLALTVLVLGGVTIYAFHQANLLFDPAKITETSLSIEIFDAKNKPLKEQNSISSNHASLASLPSYVKQAFISIEDKKFYSHHGIDIKRMGKAFLTNLKTWNLKQGASTITQQLIKNTHLSSQKTFSRKINEIALALKLEKHFTKDEILENYLNVIYFGDNCYGIENASLHYFSKPAKQLSLDEACILAGLIKSPATYSPTSKPENCTKRRNLVLSEMLKDEKITEDEYSKAIALPISLDLKELDENRLNSYSENAITEACNILKLPAKQIALGGYKIYTFQDSFKQSALEEILERQKSELAENDIAIISMNSKTGEIEAFSGSSVFRILEQKRQPGSAIKPIMVYCPALNEDMISPATLLLDEPVNIDGYTPKNVSNTYSGYISVRDAVSKSLNIPAIKVASYLGVDKIKAYAEKAGIEFAPEDSGYAVALGGMTYGTDLKSLTGAYTAISNYGEFIKPKFVSYITNSEGKIIYKNNAEKKSIFREDSAYLMTDILKSSAQVGTAKKLSSLDYEIASKTGTVGSSKGNTDAYNISYTTEDLIGVWVGNFSNKPSNIAGGNLPTETVKLYFNKIYSSHKPSKFYKPSSVEEVEIDLLELESSHKVTKANSLVPERYRMKEVFSKFNLPSEESKSFVKVLPAKLNGRVEDGMAVLEFDAQHFLSYELYKVKDGKPKLINTYTGELGKQTFKERIVSGQINTYYLITKMTNYATDTTVESDKSNIVELIYTAGKKWYQN